MNRTGAKAVYGPMRSRLRVRAARVIIAATAVIGWGGAEGAFGQPRVVIEGGSDETGHAYNWTVTNRSTSPIVYIEFPHYRASLFMTPQGWRQDCVNLVKTGAKDAPGVCRAMVQPPATGIAPGETAAFGMQITDAKAIPGRGVVRVRFADGTETAVADVPLATAPAAALKYMSLIGMGLIFVIGAVILTRRGRSAPAGAGDADDELATDADVSR